jgi:hypothetical protein
VVEVEEEDIQVVQEQQQELVELEEVVGAGKEHR